MPDKAPWLLRLIAERAELRERLTKLNDFLETPMHGVSPDDQALLVEQAWHMRGYLRVLEHRLQRAGEP